MNPKYLFNEGKKQARLFRVIAKAIDLFIAIIMAMFFYPLGIIFSCGYLALCDSIQGGQSIGKKFMGFLVISLEDGEPCSQKQSCIRNLPFIIPLVFTIIPIWGWLFSAILIVVLTSIELFFIFKLDSGNRLGDVMANTTVLASSQHQADIRKKKSSWFDENKAPSS